MFTLKILILIIMGEGCALQSWAEKSYSWKSMRSNTLEIEKYISENKGVTRKMEKIDLVITYVNSNDPEWQKSL